MIPLQSLNVKFRNLKLYKKITKYAIFSVALFCYSTSHAALYTNPSDTIRPLPQLNKQLNVVANIIMDQDSIAGMDSATILSVLAGVNTLFSPISASFSLCKVNYIYDYQYDTIGSYVEQSEMYNQYWQTNRVNLFFIDKFTGDLAAECGNAEVGAVTFNSPNGITIMKNCFTAYVLAHELGHYFSLTHTFGAGTSVTQELVNESNCSTTGDLICDTPADPFVVGTADSVYITSSCIFIDAKDKDANNQYYDPDVTNIMSYYVPCVCHFSWGQYQKMANYYLSNPIEW